MINSGNIKSVLATARSFGRDRKAASAIEFAVIVPLLLVMYLGTMELGQGIETNKKVARSASMIGDLVTQSTSLTKSELDGILVVGESILQPYYRSRPTIIITAIRLDNASPPVARVVWRRKIQNGSTSGDKPVAETIVVPAQLRIAGTFLVKVETQLAYQPVITWSNSTGYGRIFSQINMQEAYHLRPRLSAEVACSDC